MNLVEENDQKSQAYHLIPNAEIRMDVTITPKHVKGIYGHIDNPNDVILLVLGKQGHRVSMLHIAEGMSELRMIRAVRRAVIYTLTEEQRVAIAEPHSKAGKALNKRRERLGRDVSCDDEDVLYSEVRAYLQGQTNEDMPKIQMFCRRQNGLYSQVLTALSNFCGYKQRAKALVRGRVTKEGHVAYRSLPKRSAGPSKLEEPAYEIPFCYEIVKLVRSAAQLPMGIFKLVNPYKDISGETPRSVYAKIQLGNMRAEFQHKPKQLREMPLEQLELLANQSITMNDELMMASLAMVLPDQSQGVYRQLVQDLKTLATGLAVRRLLALMRLLLPREADHNDVNALLHFMRTLYRTPQSVMAEGLQKMLKAMEEENPAAQEEKEEECSESQEEDAVDMIAEASGEREEFSDELREALEASESDSKVDPIVHIFRQLLPPLGNHIRVNHYFDDFAAAYRFLCQYPELIDGAIDAELEERIGSKNVLSFHQDWPRIKRAYVEGERDIEALIEAGKRVEPPESVNEEADAEAVGDEQTLEAQEVQKRIERTPVDPSKDRAGMLQQHLGAQGFFPQPRSLRQQCVDLVWPMSLQKVFLLVSTVFSLYQLYIMMLWVGGGISNGASYAWDRFGPNS